MVRVRHNCPSSPIQMVDDILVGDAIHIYAAGRSAEDQLSVTPGHRYVEGRNGGTVESLIGQLVWPILYCSLIDMPTDFTQLAELLTVDEVAQLLKISASSVRRLQSDRKIPFVKVRGSVRFVRKDIVAYIARCRVDAIGS